MAHKLVTLFQTTAFLLIASVRPVSAELKWDTQSIDLKPRPADAVAEGKFGFVNAGQEEVTIESVKSSCGCTVPTLEKMTYGPGERGAVTARFNIGERRGEQKATIRVSLKGQREPATLTLTVAIPEVAKVTPIMLMWQAGEKPEPKTVEVEAVAGQPLRVTKASASPAGFESRVETVDDNRKYRVVVTPASTERAAFAVLNIETQLADGVKTLHAYAQVRAAGTAALPVTPPAQKPPAASVEVEPAVLEWEMGKGMPPMSLTVKASTGTAIRSLKASSNSPSFDIKVEAVRESSEYRIVVTPRDAVKEELALVNIESVTDSGTVVRRAYVQIKPR
jgi:hypothetical protein